MYALEQGKKKTKRSQTHSSIMETINSYNIESTFFFIENWLDNVEYYRGQACSAIVRCDMHSPVDNFLNLRHSKM